MVYIKQYLHLENMESRFNILHLHNLLDSVENPDCIGKSGQCKRIETLLELYILCYKWIKALDN